VRLVATVGFADLELKASFGGRVSMALTNELAFVTSRA
jgi:hypothetical protein